MAFPSSFECMSAFSVLNSFLSVTELQRVVVCSRHLHELLLPVYIGRELWAASELYKLTSETTMFVRRLCLDKPLEILPPNLVELHQLEGMIYSLDLPSKLTALSTRQLLPLRPGPWFSSLVSLKLLSFDSVLECLPPNLTLLQLRSFSKPLHRVLTTNVLPSALRSLTLQSPLDSPLYPGVLPSSLSELVLHIVSDPQCLALKENNLKTLSCISFNQQLTPGILPHSLTSLHLCSFNQQLDLEVIPSNLTVLHFSHFNQPLQPFVFPASLTQLTLENFDQPLTKDELPLSLKCLSLYKFNQPLKPFVLPSSLVRLSLLSFSHPFLDKVLPSSLIELRSPMFNYPLHAAQLPAGLEILYLDGFDQPILPGVLPESLRLLSMNNYSRPLCVGVFPTHLCSVGLTRVFAKARSSRPLTSLTLATQETE